MDFDIYNWNAPKSHQIWRPLGLFKKNDLRDRKSSDPNFWKKAQNESSQKWHQIGQRYGREEGTKEAGGPRYKTISCVIMNIQMYLEAKYNESAFKILKLLDDNKIEFSVLTFNNDDIDKVSSLIGEKVRRLPQVVVDGKCIGGYYDLMEFLINKKLINYKGVKDDID